ncbi:O-antigen ligase family protein [Haloarcula salinisoli]|uniref:O-antigen ligase family protein n=1 Tax=Haloarcula salinisoli TaxID=2487746 RepID=A0A8J7YK41_9EURY|nr:O-antigen ligase family protein [Halomicroarcula salinisoli]MBX0287828.1 O-antigen ligase family protein [Halomicroarcula salinisoli]MBX0304771.1 O-antigen ligase family protein [Halomicroarcula salinisoli]
MIAVKNQNIAGRIGAFTGVLTTLIPLAFFFSPVSRSLPLGIAPEQAIIGVVGFFLLVNTFVSGDLTLSSQNFELLSIFFVFSGLYFLTLVTSPFPVDGNNLKASITVFGAQAVLLATVTVTIGRSWWLIRRAVNAIVVLNILLVGLGLTLLLVTLNVNFFRNGIYALDTTWVKLLRAVTVLHNPNFYARTILFSFPFLLVPIETGARQGYRYLCFGSAVGSILLVILTFSRTNVIVLGVVILIIIYRYASTPRFENRAILSTLLGGGGIGFAAFFPFLLDRFLGKVSQFTAQGTTLRLTMFQTSLESFAQHPIFGTGPGTAMTVLMSDPEMKAAIIQFKGRLVPLAMHNNFLLVLVEAGAVGLALFVLFLLKYWSSLFAVKSKLRNDEKDLKIIVDATELTFVAFIISGLTAVNFGMSIIWYIFAIPLAIYRRRILDMIS